MTARRGSVPLYAERRSAKRPPRAPAREAPPRPHGPLSVFETWRCVNPHCREWTMADAKRTGRCNFCGTKRPPGGGI